MLRLARTLAIALALAGLGGVASAQWGFGPEPREVDLVVEGTLVSLGSGLVFAHGQPYDLDRGTIVVDRVVYAEQGAEVGPTIELFAAQHSGLLCPRVHHRRALEQRGVWLLHRTASPGVYTSYMGQSVLRSDDVQPAAPVVRVQGGVFDPATGTVELEVRYENFSASEAVFDEVSLDARGHVVGLGALSFTRWNPDEIVASIPASVDPPRRTLRVAPWRFARSTLSLPGLDALTGRSGLNVRVDDDDRRLARGGWIRVAGEEFGGDDLPIFLRPEDVSLTVVPALLPGWLFVVAAVSATPLVTRGRTWRWTRLSRAIGAFCALTALALAPWTIVGVISAPIAVAADALLLLYVVVLMRRLVDWRVVPAAALATLTIVMGPRALAFVPS